MNPTGCHLEHNAAIRVRSHDLKKWTALATNASAAATMLAVIVVDKKPLLGVRHSDFNALFRRVSRAEQQIIVTTDAAKAPLNRMENIDSRVD